MVNMERRGGDMLANINHKKSYCPGANSTKAAAGRGHGGFSLDSEGRKREQQGKILDVLYGRLPALFCLFQDVEVLEVFIAKCL